MKHLLKLSDLTLDEIFSLLDLADKLKYEKKARYPPPDPRRQDPRHDLSEILDAHPRIV